MKADLHSLQMPTQNFGVSWSTKPPSRRALHCGRQRVLKPLKKPLFQKRRWSCDFPPRKTPVAQKHRAISRQEKMAFSIPPVGLSWDSPPPPAESVRTDGGTYVRTDGHVTILSQPKFLGSIGYQICLAMELLWRALPAGSANIGPRFCSFKL